MNKKNSLDYRFEKDLVRLTSFSLELKDMAEEMLAYQQSFKVLDRGHYTSEEHDKIEFLLFRFLEYAWP